MSSFAIGMNKKVPFIIGQFETIEQADAAGAASDAEDYAACSVAKLGDTFTLTELAHIFNNLPGEEKVERFSDKKSAVRRVMDKFDANKDDLPPPGAKKKAAKKKAAGGAGRPRSKLAGKIKPIEREGKRWQKESAIAKAHALLVAKGPMELEAFVTAAAKECGVEKPKVNGIISKLRALKMVEIG